jgi:hypothetical protein
MKLDEAIRNWTSRAGVVRVQNALNPLLWLCVITPITWLAMYFLRDDSVIKYFLLAFGALPVFATLVAYFIFVFRDPDRLQSEEFILRQQELSIYSRSNDGAPQPMETEQRQLPNVIEVEPKEGIQVRESLEQKSRHNVPKVDQREVKNEGEQS